jgi:hypothetical protein
MVTRTANEASVVDVAFDSSDGFGSTEGLVLSFQSTK